MIRFSSPLLVVAALSALVAAPPRGASAAAFVPLRLAAAPTSSSTSYPSSSNLVRLASTPWDVDNKKGTDDKKADSANAAAEGFDLAAVTSKLQAAFQDFDLANVDLSGLQNLDLDTIKENVMGGGKFGERGEAYFAAQAFLMVCVVLGGIPLVGDALMVLLGPCLLLAGLGVAVISVKDLGSSLSPWPVPASTGDGLKTDGLYAYMRHPMYAGALAACAGLSIVTGSATRLLLTAVLLYVLDVKSDYEEAKLVEAYPDYESYRSKVTNKFFPQEVLDQMPWMKKGNKN